MGVTVSFGYGNGDRVLEETNDSNGTLVRYATAGGSYYDPLLGFEFANGDQRYPRSNPMVSHH